LQQAGFEETQRQDLAGEEVRFALWTCESPKAGSSQG